MRWSLRWRALRHRTAQTLLAVAAIGAAVALPVVLLSVGGGVYAHELSSVEASGFSISVDTALVHGVSDAHALSASIDRIPGIAAASPILSLAIDLYPTGRNPVPVLAEGVIPAAFETTQSSAERSLLPASFTLGDATDSVYFSNGTYQGPASHEMLLSTALLQTVGLTNGSLVRLAPAANSTSGQDFTVEGTFGLPPGLLGPSPLFVVILPLSQLQSLVGLAETPNHALLDAADTIQIALAPAQAADPSAVQRIAAQVQALAPYYSVTSLTEQTREIQNAEAVITGFYVGLSSVGLVVGLLFLVIILLRRVEQERQSIGIRRALGVSAWGVARGLVMEALALTGAGVLVGFTGGILTIELIARYATGSVSEIAGLAVFAPLTFLSLAAALGGLALLASLLPVRRALRLSLPEVLR